VDNLNTKWLLATIMVVSLVGMVNSEIREVTASATRNFALYGAYPQGWGLTATNITSPGPTIVVEQGDTINMTLTSQDGLPHQFWVIYINGSSTHQPNDPLSNTFTGTVNYQFVATNIIGTYEYRCYIHGRPMYGYFKVVPTGTIPELQPLAMLSLLAAGTAVAALAHRRKREG
jgi:FtsP/CotA-like multicopper oxidase with cupredoxin domain